MHPGNRVASSLGGQGRTTPLNHYFEVLGVLRRSRRQGFGPCPRKRQRSNHNCVFATHFPMRWVDRTWVEWLSKDESTYALFAPLTSSTFVCPFRNRKVGLEICAFATVRQLEGTCHPHNTNGITSCDVLCSIHVAFKEVHRQVLFRKSFIRGSYYTAWPTPIVMLSWHI